MCWPSRSPSALPPQTRSSSSSATSSWIPRQGERQTGGCDFLSDLVSPRCFPATEALCCKVPTFQRRLAPCSFARTAAMLSSYGKPIERYGCLAFVLPFQGAGSEVSACCTAAQRERPAEVHWRHSSSGSTRGSIRPHSARAETGPPRTAPGSQLMGGQLPHRAIHGVSRQAAVVRCRLKGFYPLHYGSTGVIHVITL